MVCLFFHLIDIFWSYANIKWTSRNPRTTKKNEDEFFDSSSYISLINNGSLAERQVVIKYCIQWLEILIFFLCETVPITMNSERYESCILVINSYFLFHFFLTTIRLFELPDDIVFDFHEVYLIYSVLFENTLILNNFLRYYQSFLMNKVLY